MEEKRETAELLIKKVLEQKSYLILTEEEKLMIINAYSDEMRIENKDYERYLSLSVIEKLDNIVVLVLKEYLGSWHVSSSEMNEISEYMKDIVKV